MSESISHPVADRMWQIPEPECDCQRRKHKARPAHPNTMIGRR